jgi:hypothetical protein
MAAIAMALCVGLLRAVHVSIGRLKCKCCEAFWFCVRKQLLLVGSRGWSAFAMEGLSRFNSQMLLKWVLSLLNRITESTRVRRNGRSTGVAGAGIKKCKPGILFAVIELEGLGVV